MKDSFVSVSAYTPKIRVADAAFNCAAVLDGFSACVKEGAKVVVFPELAITGSTCGDLFRQTSLISAAEDAVLMIAEKTSGIDAVLVIGFPYSNNGRLYNAAAVICSGKLLGIVPKTYLCPDENVFDRAPSAVSYVKFGKIDNVPFGTDIIFICREVPALRFAVELSDDLTAPVSPSVRHVEAGATLILNAGAGAMLVGRKEFRENLIKVKSAILGCVYVSAEAGEGESTTDLVFAGHNVIAECGDLICSSCFTCEMPLITEADLERCEKARSGQRAFAENKADHIYVSFSLPVSETKLTRHISQSPFIPEDRAERKERCETVAEIQALGLKKRLEHIRCDKVVIGLSGGLDSTLALLIAVKTFDMLSLDRKGIVGVTMPGFGTTKRTRSNAQLLAEELGCSFMEIPISAAVRQHFSDIGQSEDNHDVTYENSQARERTQILMDLGNRINAFVVGTGDISELALGWATYNGDHMSMYGVNAGVPKTLMRHLIAYFAEEYKSAVLKDILATPVSPELLPPEDGEISQKTESIVGPYELHDFFLYYLVRRGYSQQKIFRLASHAFRGEYDEETISRWLQTFLRRFFSQQFKRSCSPDGPRVGTVTLSPRGGLKMPSDAVWDAWKLN